MVVQKLKRLLKWATPYGVVEFSRNIRRDYKYSNLYLKYKDPGALTVLGKNKILKDIHKNQRCFILGTGPSINKIDINKLKNEKCIFLSQFYLHKDYQNINPSYHLFSGLSPHPNIPYKKGLEFFRHIEEQVSTKTLLFMNYLDRKFILDNNLFTKHNVHYFYFKKNLECIFNDGIDASSVLYGARGIPIMAIQIALYMGYKEIYLLGIDCCCDKDTGASHFYNPEQCIFRGIELKNEDILASMDRIEDEYRAYLGLMNEFRCLQSFAKSKNCMIYNASKGGVLDVFDRREFDLLFNSKTRIPNE